MTDPDLLWLASIHQVVAASAPTLGLDPEVLMDVDVDEDGEPVGAGVDFMAGLDDLADVDPADPTFALRVQAQVEAYADRSRALDEDEIERANEGGGSGSSRKYNRDPKGTTTGGRFTAGSAQQSSSASSSRPVYAPTPKKGGGGSTPTAPAASSKFTTLAPGADNSPEAVAQMQQLLTALGFGNLTSGTYDKQTEAAVSAVQQRLGIKPNGKANKSLITKMLNAFDLSPCIKRSGDDGPVMQIERRQSYPGQKYRHGWIPASPLALLSPEGVTDEHGAEIDAVEFGDGCRIVAREHGVTIESERGPDIAIHALPSPEDADRWADAIDNRETFTRRQFATEPYEGGMSVRFGDYGQDLDENEARDVAQGLRDMAYQSEDASHPPDDPDLPEPDDEMPIPDAARAAIDGDEFQAYWTRGKGLKRWSLNPHPWTKLRNLLRKHPGVHDAEGLASHYFKTVFGIWPGDRKGSNPVGPG